MSTHQTPWHADDRDLAAYVAGGTPPVLAASLESHLTACPTCRSRLAIHADPAEREQAWARLTDAVDRPSRRGWMLRSAVATPAMVQAALAAVLLVGIVPLLTAAVAGDMGLVALLVLAPLAPVAAVVLAYRDVADPAGEIGLATPAAGLRLVALRALLVAAVALPVAFVALLTVDLWVEDVPVRMALAWCLPGLALAAVTLLSGTTRLDPLDVALTGAGGWAILVAVAVTVHRSLRPEVLADLVAAPALQYAALAVALAAVALTVVRRDAVAYRRTA